MHYLTKEKEEARLAEFPTRSSIEADIWPILSRVVDYQDHVYRIRNMQHLSFSSLFELAKHCLEFQLVLRVSTEVSFTEIDHARLLYWVETALVPDDHFADLQHLKKAIAAESIRPMSDSTANEFLAILKRSRSYEGQDECEWKWDHCGKLGFPPNCWNDMTLGIANIDKVRVLMNFHKRVPRRVIIRSTHYNQSKQIQHITSPASQFPLLPLCPKSTELLELPSPTCTACTDTPILSACVTTMSPAKTSTKHNSKAPLSNEPSAKKPKLQQVFRIITDKVAWNLLLKVNPNFEQNPYSIPYINDPVSHIPTMAQFRSILCKRGIPILSDLGHDKTHALDKVQSVLTELQIAQLDEWVRLAIVPELLEYTVPLFNLSKTQMALMASNIVINDCGWTLAGTALTFATFSKLEKHIKYNGIGDNHPHIPHGSDTEQALVCIALSDPNTSNTFLIQSVSKVKIECLPPTNKCASAVKVNDYITMPSPGAFDEIPLPVRICQKRKNVNQPIQQLRPDEIIMENGFTSPATGLFYYDTLGKVRIPPGVDFKWGDALGCRRKIGRQYFESFILEGQEFKVGDFVVQECPGLFKKLLKIVSTFQAIHSVFGTWSRPGECLQKRGEPYIEAIPFCSTGQWALGKRCHVLLKQADSFHIGHVQAVPCALIEDGVTFTHVTVQMDVSPVQENSFNFTCIKQYGHIPLSYEQQKLLSETCPLKLQEFVYGEWAVSCNAEVIQLLKTNRPWMNQFSYKHAIHYTELSSDDSDCNECDEIHLKVPSPSSEAKFNIKELYDLRRAHANLKPVALHKKTSLPSLLICGDILDVSQQAKKRKEDEYFHSCSALLEHLQMAPIVKDDPDLTEKLDKLKHEVEMKIQGLRPLDDFFTIHTESSSPTNTCRPELIKEIRRVAKDQLKMSKGLHDLQLAVTSEAVCEPHIDTVVVAPCGYGKSACFAIPALYRHGITFVIEPLRVLVENQYNTFVSTAQRGKFDVHRLLSFDFARRIGEKDHQNVLYGLAQHSRSELTSKCTLIFSTPELIGCNMTTISHLHKAGVLTSVAFDEFDIQVDSNEDFREVYNDLLPRLREACPGISLMFLSATASKRALLSIVPKFSIPKHTMKLFVSCRAISDNLVFKVERKENLGQVAGRIQEIMGIGKNEVRAPKSLCYCLTRTDCSKMAHELNAHGINAIAFTGDNNDDGTAAGIIDEFRNADSVISVLCCTTALGRGFHHPHIRFVFHINIPVSLANYIQETGRGGRDGQKATCVLFYRNQNMSKVENIKKTRGKKLPQDRRTLLDEDMRAIATYCLSNKCRYTLLASSARTTDGTNEPRCHPNSLCDNCAKCLEGSGVVRGDLTSILCTFLASVDSDMHMHKTSTLADKHIEYLLRHAIGKKPCEEIVPFLQRFNEDFGKETSVRDDLMRHLRTCDVLKYNNHLKVYERGDNFEAFEHQLRASSVHVCIEFQPVAVLANKVTVSTKLSRVEEEDDLQHGGDRVAVGRLRDQSSSVMVARKSPSASLRLHGYDMTLDSILCGLSFLHQFEVSRALGLAKDKSEGSTQHWKEQLTEMIHECSLRGANNVEFLKSVHDMVGSAATMTSYLDNDQKNIRDSLYFQATLNPRGILTLGCPEVAVGRRIFRKFGSDRFFHVNMCSEKTPKWFEDGFHLFGRFWQFLWCKTTHSPQCYIFFAEDGIGIGKDEVITVEKVRNWCIPIEMNKDITLAKEFKRLKLSFSKTTSSGILPPQCIDIIDDIVNTKGPSKDSSIMTDGCGLISQDGIDYVWRAYHGIVDESDADVKEISYRCPCSSFQGRIGGFKGMWVVDTILGSPNGGIHLLCRPSQMKYNLPMQSLTKDAWKSMGFQQVENLYDEFYDTVDVNSWDDRPEKGRLSIRAIQLLEEQGGSYDVIEQCAKDGCKDLEDFTADKSALPKEIFHRHARMLVGSVDGDDLLFEMQAASVNPNEPVFAQMRTQFMKTSAEKMRLKGQYPIRDCWNLRMIPDHLGLLDEGEIFIAVGQGLAGGLLHAKHAVLMRNPSYFAGDMRKLKIVSYDTLVERSANDPQNHCRRLYWSLLNSTGGVVVLSTKGDRSEAHKMSGGDYDGDKAWVCWFDKLVEPITSHVAENFDAFESTASNTVEIQTLLSEKANMSNRIKYSWHFRSHQPHLGSLANLLDKAIDRFGFNCPETMEVGKQAFLQVDHPFEICKVKASVNDQLKKLNDPHWKGTAGFSSESKQVFVGKLYDFVGAAINKAVDSGIIQERCPNQHIEHFISKTFDQTDAADLKKLFCLRQSMMVVVKAYNEELSKILKRAERLHEFDLEERDAYIRTWKKCYFQQQKYAIFQSNNDNENMVVAAVLYEQSYKLATISATNRNTSVKQISKIGSSDIAWRVASDKLCTIIARAENYGSMPIALTKQSERLMFGKGKAFLRS